MQLSNSANVKFCPEVFLKICFLNQMVQGSVISYLEEDIVISNFPKMIKNQSKLKCTLTSKSVKTIGLLDTIYLRYEDKVFLSLTVLKPV